MGAQSQAQGSLSLPMATNHAQSNAISSNGTITSNGNGLMGRGGGGSISRGNSLARQGSIYSVTLEDFQRSIMEPGQNVGSMNMDEFLKNIWTMEESQAMATAIVEGGEGNNHADDQGNSGVISENGGGNTLIRQPSLAKQSSISLAPSMSTKTVEEVWQIIRKDNPTWPRGSGDGEANVGNGGVPGVSSTAFGEVTLEDFLLKAGDVVLADREVTGGLPTPTYPLFPFSGNNGNAGPTDRGNDRGERMGPGSLAATLSLSPANGIGSVSDGMDAFKQAQAQAQAQVQQAQAQHQAQQQQASEHWIMNLQQQQQAQAQAQQAQAHHQAQQLFQAQAVNAMYKRAGNGGMIPNMNSNGGYSGMASALGPGLGQMGLQLGGTMALALAPNSPTPSPASDGGANGHGNGLSLSPVNYPAEGSLRGRKRGADGPNEKVVERRQRRMIKNRESAARSRARKQAYTVELEAEVYQLKEENNRLRKEREEAANTKKKLVLECLMRQELSDDKKKLRRTSTATF